ncbi:DUF4197 domain-containing protein [Pokkaliibacter plantistimulans]|uniref:DUF4197 domain-containing protein n=1 Tax=Proteobacteria bacterium 228 TaxID=2083153 RepID=A0A2S5KNB5_9PROT|nr:DUF4197 domain-containing protein [Pokkaliibacter plantistimulans]PPC76019.1 DUF4197 domain-containing protein [Pokkaliibacter plantistimulans]
MTTPHNTPHNAALPATIRRPALSASLLCLTLAGGGYAHADLNSLLNQGQKILEQQQKQQGTTSSTSSGTSSASTSNSSSLSQQTVISGLKEALSVGTERAVSSLAKTDGYMKNTRAHIPLPGMLGSAAGLMRQAGLGTQVDAFELSMNRAAEQAVTQATPIFVDAIKSMTIQDAQRIYQGSDTAATEYFRGKTQDQLARLFRPSIEKSMASNGVTSAYQSLSSSAKSAVPMLGGMNLDLTDYVTNAALSGLFTMVGEEEKQIRKDPVAQSTSLLKTLFGK